MSVGVEALRAMRLVTYFDVAASTVFIWDYLITLPMEIRFVWRSKWNFMKLLYFIQRYLPFVDTIGLVLYHQLGQNISTSKCRQLYTASGWMLIAGMAFSEMILTMRIWAVWNRNIPLGATLTVLFAILWGTNFAFVGTFVSSLTFGSLPYPQVVGCVVTHANRDSIICWAIILTWDALTLGLIMVPGFRSFRAGGSSALTRAVYRDGALYYLYLFLLSSINIVIVKILPPQYTQLLTSTERLFHSILTSRVLLHIRANTGGSEYFDYDDPDDSVFLELGSVLNPIALRV